LGFEARHTSLIILLVLSALFALEDNVVDWGYGAVAGFARA